MRKWAWTQPQGHSSPRLPSGGGRGRGAWASIIQVGQVGLTLARGTVWHSDQYKTTFPWAPSQKHIPIPDMHESCIQALPGPPNPGEGPSATFTDVVMFVQTFKMF